MSIIDIIDVFVFYGLDVAALALATSVIVQVLKKTILKNVPNKLYTFLPFVIGTFLYAVYSTIYNLDWQFCFQNFAIVLENGIATGALSTLLYVLYEQFIRGNNDLTTAESVIAQLIEGYVSEEKIEQTAKLIADVLADDSTESYEEAAALILKDNSSDAASESDLQLLAKLICKTLATLSAE